MTQLPSSTKKSAQSALLDGVGGLGGERLSAYNLFSTDGFGAGDLYNVNGHVYRNEEAGVPDMIDGYRNDDSYRRSSRVLSTTSLDLLTDGVAVDHLRENSLARQLDEKPDQPGIIRLVRRLKPEEFAEDKSPGPKVPWVNLIPPNTKFLMETVQESRQEKFQIIDTFGEWVAFFFGRRPEVYNYTGTLINSKNHDWKNEFQWNYDNFLRGSQAVKHRATMILQYDDVMVEGYMLNSSIQMTGVADKSVPFTFSMLVINRSQMNPTKQLGLRFLRSDFSAAEGVAFNSLQDSLDLTKNNQNDMQTFLLMREYFSGNYIPAAGKFTQRVNTNNVESEETTTPGQKGGTANPKPISANFRSKQSGALNTAGITITDRLAEQTAGGLGAFA